MSSIAEQANATRRELEKLEEQLGPDDPTVEQMRKVALEWLAELQDEHRLAGIVPSSKTA
jgi:hypothetical protein